MERGKLGVGSGAADSGSRAGRRGKEGSRIPAEGKKEKAGEEESENGR